MKQKHKTATSYDWLGREVFFEDEEQSIHTIWITDDVIQTIWLKKDGSIIHRLSDSNGNQLMNELFRTKFTHDDTVSIRFLPQIVGRILKIELTASQVFYDIEVESKEGFERLYHINEGKLEMVEPRSYDTTHRQFAFHNMGTELLKCHYSTMESDDPKDIGGYKVIMNNNRNEARKVFSGTHDECEDYIKDVTK